MELSYIFFKKMFLIFREMKLSSLKLKNFIIFLEMELSSHKIKNFLIFEEGTWKA